MVRRGQVYRQVAALALRAWHEDTDRRERRQSVLEREERIIAVFLDTQKQNL